eukprot:1845628-Pyramimonas_sp.AAC.1
MSSPVPSPREDEGSGGGGGDGMCMPCLDKSRPQQSGMDSDSLTLSPALPSLGQQLCQPRTRLPLVDTLRH